MIGPDLHEPAAGDHGARGAFDGRALSISPQTWAIRHRSVAYPAAVAVAIGAAAAFAGIRRSVTSG